MQIQSTSRNFTDRVPAVARGRSWCFRGAHSCDHRWRGGITVKHEDNRRPQSRRFAESSILLCWQNVLSAHRRVAKGFKTVAVNKVNWSLLLYMYVYLICVYLRRSFLYSHSLRSDRDVWCICWICKLQNSPSGLKKWHIFFIVALQLEGNGPVVYKS